MISPFRAEIYTKAINQFGRDAQILMAIEEFAELTVELSKYLNGRKPLGHDLVSELADAEIMLEQVIFALGCKAKVKFEADAKLERLSKRLDTEKQISSDVKELK